MKPAMRTCEVLARDLDEAGMAVATSVDHDPAAGVDVRVADLLPGERAVVAIDHTSPHRPRAWGHVIERLGPAAAERVAPACPGFGRCGGCAWQHMAYAAQLEHKRARVARALAGEGISAVVEAVVPAPASLGYRNTGKYVAGVAEPGGELILGAYAPGTHRVVDTGGCRVVEPVIDDVRQEARRVLGGMPVYDERTRTGQLRYVVIRAGMDGRALVAVVTSKDTPGAAVQAAAHALVTDERVSGVVWVRNDSRSGAILSRDIECVAGRATVCERVAGVDIELGIGDFFQINRDQAARLYARVAELARGAARVMDIYCGAGGIGFALARAGTAEIAGIERNPGAVGAANRAAERAGLHDRLRVYAGRAADAPALARHVLAGGGVDLVVVNPPRKGLDAETLAAMRALAPARIIYVSCGPETLARDIALLDDYRIARVMPFDLMPGTAQVETIATLHHA